MTFFTNLLEFFPNGNFKAPDVAQSIGFRALGFRVSYLSGTMGNQRLTLFIMQGLYRDYTTPKRLKVTYSTSRRTVSEGHSRTAGSNRNQWELTCQHSGASSPIFRKKLHISPTLRLLSMKPCWSMIRQNSEITPTGIPACTFSPMHLGGIKAPTKCHDRS